MNYLGHALLSESDNILIGNFIADAVKGKALHDYPESIKDGILLHREIDCYTDSHPAFLRIKHRLMPKYRFYSSVIADIYLDHFLACGWSDFSQVSLKFFTQYTYNILEQSQSRLPIKFQELLPFMISDDWLYNYQNIDGISRTFEGLSRRASFDSGMEYAAISLFEEYSQFKKDARCFLADVVKAFPGKYSLF